jgi:hypothetical protein
MLSEKMGRRKFMRNMSSALLGVVSSPFWSGLSLARAEIRSGISNSRKDGTEGDSREYGRDEL